MLPGDDVCKEEEEANWLLLYLRLRLPIIKVSTNPIQASDVVFQECCAIFHLSS
jgi:hypothetical protein